MVKALRNRFVDRVFVGRNTIFALGEDVAAGSRKIKLKAKNKENEPKDKENSRMKDKHLIKEETNYQDC